MKNACLAATASLLLLVAVALHARESQAQESFLVSREGVGLTQADLDAYVREAPADLRAGLFATPKRAEQILMQLMLLKTLAREAEEQRLEDDPVVKARLELARVRMLAQLRIEQLQQAADVDAEALARERYMSNPSRFNQPETVTVRHILVEARNRSLNEARARIDTVIAQLAAGADFGELARAYSDDASSAAQGGLLPPATRTDFDKAFSDAAFELKSPGERSGAVRSSYGYHVIELVERTPARPRPFDEIRGELVRQIRAEHAERIAKEHSDRINARPLDVDEAAFAKLVDRYRRLYGDGESAADAGEGAD